MHADVRRSRAAGFDLACLPACLLHFRAWFWLLTAGNRTARSMPFFRGVQWWLEQIKSPAALLAQIANLFHHQSSCCVATPSPDAA
jgi:hypothetical protein